MKYGLATILLLLLSRLLHASDMDVSEAETRIQAMARGRTAPLSIAEVGELKSVLQRSGLFRSPRLRPATISALGQLIFMADADKEFQSDVLTGELQLFQRVGIDVDARGYANLVDRVDAKNGRPPTYGWLRDMNDSRLPSDRIRDIEGARRYIGIYSVIQGAGPAPLSDGSLPLTMRRPVYPTMPSVRAELLDLFALDQHVRDFDDSHLDESEKRAAHARMKEADAQILAQFRPIFEKYGIPGNRAVGRFGTLAAWTIVQHSITAPELMRKAAVDAERLHADGELADGPYALLVDRVACVIEHKPQTYGTFPVGNAKSAWYCPVKNPEQLNERRASVFMEPVSSE